MDKELPSAEVIFEQFKEQIEETMLKWITNYPDAAEITLGTARMIARRAKEAAVTAFLHNYPKVPTNG